MKSQIKIPFGYQPPQLRERIFARSGPQPRNAATDPNVIEIFDEISPWGTTPASVSAALRSAGGKPVTVQINSPGGMVFDGAAIFNLLINYSGTVRIEILGLAASAASIIAMAGDQVAIAENAALMIHRSWSFVLGDFEDCESMAALLKQCDAAMVGTYADRTGGDPETIIKLMEAETWLFGEDAKTAGFVDEVIGEKQVEAKFDLSRFKRAPEGLGLSGDELIRPNSPVELERRAHQRLGLSKADAKALVRGGWDAMTRTSQPSAQSNQAEIAVFIETVAKATAKLKGTRQ